jgi:hypothetical protein
VYNQKYSTCVVYNCIRKTQATEVQRREEKILEEEQQNITASAEHAAYLERTSTEALQVREKLQVNVHQFLGDKKLQ